jgi:hypothetical protein
MKNGGSILTTLVLALALAACGGGEDAVPDADLTPIYDSEPPPIDAAECPGMVCDSVCVDTDTDDLHCGDCDTACTQNGSTCTAGDCVCPLNFLPAETAPSGFDQVVEAQPGLVLAAGIVATTELNVFGVGFDPATTETGVAYTLDGATLPAPPLAFAIYNVNISSDPPTFEAAYAAIDGTLTYDTVCSVGATGTLTNATFQAANIDLGGGSITLDPEGCTFELAAIDFAIGEDCPVKALH